MSWDEFSVPPDAGAEQAPGAGAPDTSAGDADEMTLRQQVVEIIDAVLADTDPGGEWARTQLRDLIEAHPDDPEGALLEHLIATRNRPASPPDRVLPPDVGVPHRVSSVKPRPVPVSFSPGVRKRIKAVLRDKLLLTAFQPINELPAGNVIGVEALTRFVSHDGASADVWFREAAAAGLGTDLEIAALHCALTAAKEVPRNLFVTFNLTPATCHDPRVPATLGGAQLAHERIVVEITGSPETVEGLSWADALGPLRWQGVRLAVSASGAGFVSMDQITQLRPDIIKLDRNLIEGIQDSEGQRIRAASIVELAHQIGAAVIAEGIETWAELTAVKALGVTAGQGYLLGRPSIQPLDWSAWTIQAQTESPPAGERSPLR
ncbi:EAL domain-containing protein [Arthrobacter sp. ISL-28]|uniref:EAL domain-containing protein n=1 Tax=Arthrobacter sp. ISL-28 TaxID=2819108 RepID=UPI001BE6BFF0|nr:EAL domain-containing protein [Arthrobacter sp. ISL-28]MBT2521161.1 EAL domain-containing protein [Arthrobacter sp. ISL-28]